MRAQLHPSLSTLEGEALLERFEWEWARLPIIHNAPVSAVDANESCVTGAKLCDASPIDATIASGFLQNVCIREAIGGPQLQASAGSSTLSRYASSRSPLGFGSQHRSTAAGSTGAHANTSITTRHATTNTANTRITTRHANTRITTLINTRITTPLELVL